MYRIKSICILQRMGEIMKKLFICMVFIVSCFSLYSPPTYAASNQLIIINKSTNHLAYYKYDKLQKIFIVATGRKPSYTPEGKFKVVTKIVNRPYYKENIKGGDPRNPLGKRWIGINARNTPGNTYAIHGNNNASLIGKYVSAGCIRMYNEDVKWLYSQVTLNTPVIITSTTKSFKAIAAAYDFKVTGSEDLPVNKISSVLKKGSKGLDVTVLQKKLTALGYDTKGNNGIFDLNTENALKKFQADKKLTVDGIVGPQTKKALGLK